MNLGQLIEACEQRSGMNATNYKPQWRSFLNEGVRRFASQHPWPALEDYMTLTSDGTKYLLLPQYVDTVISLLNTSDRNPVDRFTDADRQFPDEISAGTTGRVWGYDKIGIVPVIKQPANYITARSDSASDTGIAVHATGYVAASGSSGTGLAKYLTTASITLSGVSPVTLPANFTDFVSISKATDTVGTIFFREPGGSPANRTISMIPWYETDAAFKRIELIYTPSAQTLFTLRFRRKIPPLVSDTQAPPPAVDADYLIQHALSCFWKHQQQFTKSEVLSTERDRILAARIQKEQNFDEPWNQITPIVDCADRDPTLW